MKIEKSKRAKKTRCKKCTPYTNRECCQPFVNSNGLSKKMAQSKAKQKHPWLSEDGVIKKDEQLKIECQEWTLDEWEDYLQTIEATSEKYVSSSSNIDELLVEDFASLVATEGSSTENGLLLGALEEARKSLNETETQIIDLCFVENLKQSDIARRLGFSRQYIGKKKTAAIKKLRKKIEDNSLTRKEISKARPRP